MTHAYTPGLKVTSRERHRCRRILPIAGDVLVSAGDRVQALDIVAQAHMPGDITPVNVANLLSLPPKDVAECMLHKEGDRIEVGQVLARTPGIFGLFKSECKAKVGGTIESISPVTGQVIIRGEPQPVEVRAYLTGEVIEVIPREGVVIESEVSFIQGIFGISGEAYGPIRMACREPSEPLTADRITQDMQGAVVVGGARMTGEAVKKAIEIGAAAMVAGGMDDQDLKDILGFDLGVAITGSEEIGMTLIITEGFGEIAMAERTFQLLKSRAGDSAATNGTTQIRAGVIRPEIIIPHGQDTQQDVAEDRHTSNVLEIGTPVRVIRDPHFGLIGTVSELPSELRTLESGSKARILEVELRSGQRVIVPRANVEIMGA